MRNIPIRSYIHKRKYVVTRREALRMLGVREGALARLERDARVPRVARRDGYTAGELRRLLSRLKELLRGDGA